MTTYVSFLSIASKLKNVFKIIITKHHHLSKMPNILKPKSSEEEVQIIEYLEKNVVPEGVSVDRLRRWRKNFFVEEGELHSLKAVDKDGRLKGNSRIFLNWHLDSLFKKFHREKGHPGRDALCKKLKERYCSVPQGKIVLNFRNCFHCNSLRCHNG